MEKRRFKWKEIPGWVVMAGIFGVLYLTGLHTEAISQVQRLMLATGLQKADLPSSLETSETAKTAAPDQMAGAGFKMTGLDGQTISFESLKGKVVFLNIWATWCPPCVAEMPNIQRLYEKVGSDKIAFVMLSVDRQGLPKVKKYIGKKGYTFPVYVPAANFPAEFESSAIPTTFIISPAGKIVAMQEGMAEYDTPEVVAYLHNLPKQAR